MQKITNISAIITTLFSLTSYAMPVLASHSLVNHPNIKVHFQQPQLPDNGTPTGRRKGAAGRGNCAYEQRLTALVPTFEKNLPEGRGKVTYVWGQSITEYPTFWFYVPYAANSLRSVEFVLQDGEDDVYRSPVKLLGTPGIINFRLPSTAKPLEVGKMYHWFFKVNVNCESQQLSHTKDYVEGWVQRVKLNSSLSSQLKTATPQQRIAIYAANGIWYEALNAIADSAQEDATPKDDWAELLQSAGLSDISSKPFVQCCNLENAYSLRRIGSVNR